MLQGLPIVGEMNSYPDTGYVYEMRGQLSYIRGNMSLLKQMQWVDRQTRAVIVEFSAYNPAINLIMVTTILVEFLPSGQILTAARYDPLNLFNEMSATGGFASFKIACSVIFMIFIVYFMIKEVRELVKMGLKSYVKQAWFLIEWFIIACSWVTISIFFYRLSVAYDVLDFFRKTHGYAYIKLQRVNELNQVLNVCLGLCSGFATLKIFRLLRFNRKLSCFGTTLKYCLSELIGFSFASLLMWMAFVQLMFLIFNTDLEYYSTIVKSMQSSFEILDGKFDVKPLMLSNPVLGPIVFVSYNVMIVFISLNIFISIVIDAFREVKLDAKRMGNDFDFIDYIFGRQNSVWRFSNSVKAEMISKSHTQYKDLIDVLPKRIDELIHLLSVRMRIFC